MWAGVWAGQSETWKRPAWDNSKAVEGKDTRTENNI